MAQPQVVADETVKAPANGGTRQRTQDEGSQPAALARPLLESARRANERTTHTLLGVPYNVTAEGGYRRA